jgi:hypothetical protein
MNLTSARKVAEFVNITKTDEYNRVTEAIVPGHGSKSYTVKIKRTSRGKMTATCICSDGSDCPGSKNSICYHSLAALISSAARAKVRLSFCSSKTNAQNLANIAGKQFSLTSKQSGKQVWVVAAQEIDPNMLIC